MSPITLGVGVDCPIMAIWRVVHFSPPGDIFRQLDSKGMMDMLHLLFYYASDLKWEKDLTNSLM